jgi:tryptophan halogenase
MNASVKAEQIRSIAIVGDGVAAWMTAAALHRSLRNLGIRITVVGRAISSRGSALASLPALSAFHRLLGIDERDVLRSADATFSLGTQFIDWSANGHEFAQIHGEYGAPAGGVDFHQQWLCARAEGLAATLSEFSLAAVAARRGKFAFPVSDARSPLSTFSYGLHLDEQRYRDLLRDYCLRQGVAERAAEVARMRRRSNDGFIEALQLDDGSDVVADLYVDCSSDGTLTLEQVWDDWSGFLPTDRVARISRRPDQRLASGRIAMPVREGWRLSTTLRSRVEECLYYRSELIDDASAEEALLTEVRSTDKVSISACRTGRISSPWSGNCVAIGASACRADALIAVELHLIQTGVTRLIEHFPYRDCSRGEAGEYNRVMVGAFDRLRDYAIVYFDHARDIDSPFWTRCRSIAEPPALQRKLMLFAARGRVVMYDDDLFDKQTWAATLLGLDIVPERIDVFLDNVDGAAVKRNLEQMAAVVAREVERMPDHADLLEQVAGPFESQGR